MMFSELNTDYDYDKTANVWFRRDQQSTFRYNDGDEIENRIYAIVQKSFDRSVASRELGANITDWASLYHLSPQRANLLRPLIDQITGPVLEIGCGCGAITRFLGESGLEVLALEGSARRAAITAERCRDLPNVQVLAEPFQDFQTTRKFKTITLIGVLEYARAFFAKGTERDPVDLMLERVVELLEPDGMLIVAIENQLGLKYFAGFKEDHLAKPMVGIEGQYNEQSVVTFGKRELGRRFQAAGLAEQQWWFPFPDYKLPVSVLSERAFDADVPADFSALISEACRSDAQAPAVPTFSLDLAWPAIARNGLCGELANSFLVILSREQISTKTTFGYHYGTPRKQAYAKVVEFKCEEGEFFVERKVVSEAVMGPDELHLDLAREPLQDGELWRHRLRNILLRDGWSMRDLELWSKVWWFTLLDKFDLGSAGDNLTPASLVPANALDALPRNLVVSESGAIHFIDQEWVAPKPIELGYILYRGLSDALFGVEFCGKPSGDFSLKIGDLVIAVSHALEIPLSVQDLLRYFEQERQFQEQVVGRPVRMNPEAFLARPLAQRVTYYGALAAQQQLLLQKDQRIKQLLDDITETQTKLVAVMKAAKASTQMLAHKDTQIEALMGLSSVGSFPEPMAAAIAPSSRRILYSMVVDDHPMFVFQAYYCAKSIVEYGGAKPADVYVQFTQTVSDEIVSIFSQKGYSTHRIPSFGDNKYCNKISQLSTFRTAEFDYLILLDADTMVLGNLSHLAAGEALKAKPVDTPNPPIAVLAEVAAQAGLVIDGRELTADNGAGNTLIGNCNGGVYVIPRQMFDTLDTHWRKWALWLLDNPATLAKAGRSDNIDQVSMWMTIISEKLAYQPLNSNFNYYGHMRGLHIHMDGSKPIDVLHYHEHCVTDQGLLTPMCDRSPNVDIAYNKANALIRTEFRNDLFWNLRYKTNPKRGSGIGSRGENLEYKRKILLGNGVERLDSVLDIGCGDLEVVKALDIRNYLGLDRSMEAIRIASAAKPEWNFKEFDLHRDADAISEHELVICFEVLIHQGDRDVYRSLVDFAASKTKKRLIISGYDVRNQNIDNNYLIFFHEPLSETLRKTGRFSSIVEVGAHTDVAVFRCDV